MNNWFIAEDVYGSQFLFYWNIEADLFFKAKIYDDESNVPLGGLTMDLLNDQWLAEFEFLGKNVPPVNELSQLAAEARKAIDAYDSIAEIDLRKAIKDEIKEQGLSKRDVSKISGVAYSTLDNYLARNQDVGSDKIQKILNALGLSIKH